MKPIWANNKPHANLFRNNGTNKGLYCIFCHKLRNSENTVSVWKLDKKSSYSDYISSTIYIGSDGIIDSSEIDYNVSSIVDLCLSCHEMTKHDNNYGHSFTSKVIGNNKTKIVAKIGPDGKISGKLKLYNNTMTCTTCHDPHESNFKLLTNSLDKLCNDCHQK
ncbi:MAG: cytochrome c3 family protein [Calditerrivibrio sp.]|nr:cytochrome c3 family protein [Calditerrivibrio sp.]